MLPVGEPGLSQMPLRGKPRFAGFPWPEAAKGTRLQAHPFLRKGPHPGPKRSDLSHKERYYKSKKIQTIRQTLAPFRNAIFYGRKHI